MEAPWCRLLIIGPDWDVSFLSLWQLLQGNLTTSWYLPAKEMKTNKTLKPT
jgi:hypothetical protein